MRKTTIWQNRGRDWWFTDFTRVGRTTRLHRRALPGYWQTATYRTDGFAGVMVLANPKAAAPDITVRLPAKGRYSILLGLVENYCDRVLVKLQGQPFFDRLAHGDVSPADGNCLQEVWYKDVDLREGDALVIRQDAAMARRCAVAYVRLAPAPAPTAAEIPLIATVDGYPGNNGVISFDEMLAEELQFGDTQVAAICHGTDISGQAQYNTRLPRHRYTVRDKIEEVIINSDYYPWALEQMRRYEKAGRCPLRDSVGAAHRSGRKLYAYHRMAVTRLYAPFRMFANPMFDAHPEWRCVDLDGTPVSRLSIAFPEVRKYFLEHFRETVKFGADGVCLTICRGWPLVLCEKPVAAAYRKRTGKELRRVRPDDPDLRAVRTEIVNRFIREIHETVVEAGGGRAVEVVALPLAHPRVNRHFGMDCRRWALEGWVQILCPYPYGYSAKRMDIDVPAWRKELRGTRAALCPMLNRGSAKTGPELLKRAEQWLRQGVTGLTMWDWDNLSVPAYRLLAANIGSREGRQRLHKLWKKDWPVRRQVLTFDGIAVDRYHPGWNV